MDNDYNEVVEAKRRNKQERDRNRDRRVVPGKDRLAEFTAESGFNVFRPRQFRLFVQVWFEDVSE